MTINCSISWSSLLIEAPCTLEMRMLGKLRDAGIPVKGVLVFGGIESGELRWYDDWVGRHFIWYETTSR